MADAPVDDGAGALRRRRVAVRVVGLLAGLALGKASFDFGEGLGGLWFGLLLGVNGLVFGALVAAGLVDRWFDRRGDEPPRRP